MRRQPIWAWVLLPVVVVLSVAVLWPVTTSDGPSHRRVCLSNLKELGVGNVMYAADNDEKLPFRDQWMDLLIPYTKNPSLFHCNLVNGPGLYGYAMNAGVRSTNMPDSDRVYLLYDSVNLARNASDLANSLPIPGRHEGRNNVVMVDNHAMSIAAQ